MHSITLSAFQTKVLQGWAYSSNGFGPTLVMGSGPTLLMGGASSSVHFITHFAFHTKVLYSLQAATVAYSSDGLRPTLVMGWGLLLSWVGGQLC